MKNKLGLIALLITANLTAQAEHPTNTKSELPTTKPQAISIAPKGEILTAENLAQAIRSFVEADIELRGYFLVLDSKSDEVLRLTLDKVHKERLSHIGDDVYFACADFKEENGKIYDIDIFLKGNNTDDLTLTDISVHKEEGEARYSWEEDNGLWTKVFQ